MYCTQVWAVGFASVWACTNISSPPPSSATKMAFIPQSSSNDMFVKPINKTNKTKHINNTLVDIIMSTSGNTSAVKAFGWNASISLKNVSQKKCFRFCSFLSNGTYLGNLSVLTNSTFVENETFGAQVLAPSPTQTKDSFLKVHENRTPNISLLSRHRNGTGKTDFTQCDCEYIPDLAPFHAIWITFVLIALVFVVRQSLNKRNKVSNTQTQTPFNTINPGFNP